MWRGSLHGVQDRGEGRRSWEAIPSGPNRSIRPPVPLSGVGMSLYVPLPLSLQTPDWNCSAGRTFHPPPRSRYVLRGKVTKPWDETVNVLSVPCDWELFLLSFLTEIEKSTFAKSIASYHVPESVVICYETHCIFMTAVISGYYFIELVVANELFCIDQIDTWRHDRDHYPCILQILEGGNTLLHLHIMRYYFVFLM